MRALVATENRQKLNAKLKGLLTREYEWRINLGYLLASGLFWSYGIQGAINSASLLIQLFLAFYFSALLVLYICLGRYQSNLTVATIRASGTDIVYLLVLIIFLLASANDKLHMQIVGDHFSYAQSAKNHELYLLSKLSDSAFISEHLSAKQLIHAIDLLLILSLVGTLVIFKRMKLGARSTTVILLLAFFICRVAVILTGGGASPHPPLQLLPIAVSSSLFGISDFSFRVAQYVGLIAFACWAYLYSVTRINRRLAFLLAIALCTVPLLMYAATLVEASIWTALAWSVFLITIFTTELKTPRPIFLLATLLSLSVMLRISAFLAFVPFLILIAYQNRLARGRAAISILFALTPVLLFVPFLIQSVLVGTPAIYIPGESTFIPSDASTLSRLWFAITEGVASWTILNTVRIPWLLLPLLILIKFPFEKNYYLNRFSAALLFILAAAMFFTIRPVFWSNDRYKAEYIIPFVSLGLFIFYHFVTQYIRLYKLLTLCTIVFIGYGLKNFYLYPQTVQADSQQHREFKHLSENIYNYREALDAIKSAGLSKNIVIIGATYGSMPLILANYNNAEVQAFKRLSKDAVFVSSKTSQVDVATLNSKLDVKVILISDPDDLTVKVRLRDIGWHEWRSYVNSDYDTTIHAFVRKPLIH
jgi:hypothetical protein